MNGTRPRRRDFLASAAAIGTLSMLPARAIGAAIDVLASDDVAWLDETPPTGHDGQSWGQPWPRGTRYRSGYALAGKRPPRGATELADGVVAGRFDQMDRSCASG
jgi:hypothetical protein